MKEIKIIIDGKEISAQIDDAVRQQLLQPVKKTGYERVNSGEKFYLPVNDSSINTYHDDYSGVDDILYNVANYYSDKTVAENNARADKLMRQLRRFAVEHREKELDWESILHKYTIVYGAVTGLSVTIATTVKSFGSIYFDTKETAQLAIDTFKEELLWYFIEYKDSL